MSVSYMDNQKPVTAEEAAKLKKNGKTMLVIAAAVFALIVFLTLFGNGAPTWLILITGISLGLGFVELRKAKKAEEALKDGGASVPPSEPTV